MTDLLTSMRQRPAGDWTIGDVMTLCDRHGVRCSPPSGGGSHFKVSHASQPAILTIPRTWPIKPVYIRRLVKFIEAIGISDDRA